jgi:hypothetical protein
MKYAKLDCLLGKVLITAAAVKDARLEDRIIFEANDGSRFLMYHRQYCCEDVSIESVVGDFGDLIGHPILIADQSSCEGPVDGADHYEHDSHTWTFYKFATIKGYVDIRWHGQSNGYYSEEVDFFEIEPNDDFMIDNSLKL